MKDFYIGWRHLSTLVAYCFLKTVTFQMCLGSFGSCGGNGGGSPECLSNRG